MAKGFYNESIWRRQREPLNLVPQCGMCGLDKKCQSPHMPVTGEGKKKILIIGETATAIEDQRHTHFMGDSGGVLAQVLHRVGVNLRKDCWSTNAVICRPWVLSEEGGSINRLPTNEEISYCRPNLANTINKYKPEIIIPLGYAAVYSLIHMAWKESEVESIGTWVGWKIPSVKLNAWICPTYHPLSLLEEKGPVMELLLSKHLTEAVKLKGRPWPEGPPNYKTMVECIYEHDKAAKAIEEMMQKAIFPGIFGDKSLIEPLAFDYETTMLKPESSKAKILSCSLSDGHRTIAYPMVGDAIEATKRFLNSNIPKIAANMPFEDRWSRKKLGVIPRNWYWDTLLGAHWLDCRKGIVSVKFQSFVLLGADDYSYIIDPDKTSRGANSTNNMDKVELSDLLLYNGLDSLFEYRIAMKQMQSYK